MHFHSQKLGKSLIKHGKCWWHLSTKKTIGLEWCLFNPDIGIGVDFEEYGSHNGILLSFGCGLVSLYLSLDMGWRFKRNREYSVRIFDNTIWFACGRNPDEWRKGQPWYWDFNFCPADFFLGRPKYSSKVLSEHNVVIPMPEGCYDATIKLEESTWKRPRWFKRTLRRADIEIPKGIGYPGKGENSWDCGDDAMFGLTCPAENLSEAIGKAVSSVLESRLKYGRSIYFTPSTQQNETKQTTNHKV